MGCFQSTEEQPLKKFPVKIPGKSGSDPRNPPQSTSPKEKENSPLNKKSTHSDPPTNDDIKDVEKAPIESEHSQESLNIDDINNNEKIPTDFQTKMQNKISEHIDNNARLKSLRHAAFNKQFELFRDVSTYHGLYHIWTKYAIEEETKMNMDGLTSALKHFGMIIDTSRHLQQRVYDAFDLDKVGTFDYDDFNATMASIVASSTDDILYIVFMIFDLDDDGYLMLEDMARVLLCLNQVAVVVTGHGQSRIKYTKVQCIKQAKKMMDTFDSSEFTDNKISCDEFLSMMKSRTEQDMLIDLMSQPSLDAVQFQTSLLSSENDGHTIVEITVDGTPIETQTQISDITPLPSDL